MSHEAGRGGCPFDSPDLFGLILTFLVRSIARTWSCRSAGRARRSHGPGPGAVRSREVDPRPPAGQVTAPCITFLFGPGWSGGYRVPT